MPFKNRLCQSIRGFFWVIAIAVACGVKCVFLHSLAWALLYFVLPGPFDRVIRKNVLAADSDAT